MHIYFDAFEYDYSEDPFLAISGHIYSLIEESDDETKTDYKQRATVALKEVGRAGLRVGIKALTAGILDETILDETGSVSDASIEASDIVDAYISRRLTIVNEVKNSLKCFKGYLGSLGDTLGGEGKIIFIIDELDKCKLKFALSIIESIKNLFFVPNIVFLLVMNRG